MKKSIYRWAGAAGLVGALAVALPLLAANNDNEEKEETVSLQDCPAAVQKTISDNAQGGEVIEVEKETGKDGKVVYEAEVKKSDGKKVEIEVAEDGTLIGTDEDKD